MSSTAVLVTGGAGVIGSNFVHMLAELRPAWKVANLDALPYAGNLETLEALAGRKTYHFVHGDITSAEDVERAFAHLRGATTRYLVHFAAESHVDRSIQSGLPFVHSNVVGTQV